MTNMHSANRYSIDKVLTVGDTYMYEIVDKDGTIYATAYDLCVATLIKDVLNKRL